MPGLNTPNRGSGQAAVDQRAKRVPLRQGIEPAKAGKPRKIGHWCPRESLQFTNLLQAAVAEVRREISATQFQIFDLNVLKEWPAGEVARALGVSAARIYLAKHRVSDLLKKAVKKLEARMADGVPF